MVDLKRKEFTIPRLKSSRTVVGPDYHGCVNSGLQPCLSCLPDGTFIVGPVVLVRDAQVRLKFLIRPNQRFLKEGRREVRRFKSQPPADQVYRKLVHDVWDHNRETRKEINRLTDRARRGDLRAAVALGDY